MSRFTIGKLAKSANVNVETVRFYERLGLLQRPAPRRDGFREYQPSDTERICFIKRAQGLGYTLREIKELLELDADQRTSTADYVVRIKRKVEEIDFKIRDLERMRQSLDDILTSCENGTCKTNCQLSTCFENGCDVPASMRNR